MATGAGGGEKVLTALSGALSSWGLNLLLPLAAETFDAACAPVAADLRVAGLLPGGRAAVLVCSGGRAFFDRFAGVGGQAGASDESRDGDPNPLDRFTRRVVGQAVEQSLSPVGVRHAVYFPFVGTAPLIPFQRLGRAAGLGGSSPLGLQVHPVFGPWWAYRALIVVDRALSASEPPGDGCAGCPAPCIAACPAGAVAREGFEVKACHARRLAAEPCRLSCAARIACIRGPEHRYREEQLAFHMAASMPKRLPVA